MLGAGVLARFARIGVSVLLVIGVSMLALLGKSFALELRAFTFRSAVLIKMLTQMVVNKS